MFSRDIVRSDAFLDMPVSSQLLYFQLGMEADDDGFLANGKMVIRMAGANDDDLKILLAKRFVLSFQSGVIVIKHWKINNLIQKDRYKQTRYVEEKNGLKIKENQSYTECIQTGNNSEPQSSLGKVSLGKVSLGEREVAQSAPTPKEISKDFFEKGETYQKVFAELQEKIPSEMLNQEIVKFVSYWTEPNATGKKLRWEQERNFEIRRRLATWFSRIKNYQSAKGKSILV